MDRLRVPVCLLAGPLLPPRLPPLPACVLRCMYLTLRGCWRCSTWKSGSTPTDPNHKRGREDTGLRVVEQRRRATARPRTAQSHERRDGRTDGVVVEARQDCNFLTAFGFVCDKSDDDLRGVRTHTARGRVQRGAAGPPAKLQEMRGVRRRWKSAGSVEEGPREVGGGRMSNLQPALAT